VLQNWMVGWQINDELERIWKEAATALISVQSQHMPWGIIKIFVSWLHGLKRKQGDWKINSKGYPELLQALCVNANGMGLLTSSEEISQYCRTYKLQTLMTNLRSVLMAIAVFWDRRPHNLVNIHQHLLCVLPLLSSSSSHFTLYLFSYL
jgi:hypothetical protein